MVGILLIGLAFVVIAVSLLLRSVALPRARAAERLAEIDAYGFESSLTTLATPSRAPDNSVATLVTRIGGLAGRYLGRMNEDDLRSELLAAGMYTMAPRTLLGYRVVAAILTPTFVIVVFGTSVLSVVLAAASLGAGWLLPLVLVRRRARRRLDQIDRRLPGLIDILVVTVEAGLGFSSALRVAASQFSGPLSDELRLTLQEQSMGLSSAEALTNMLSRSDTPAMRSFVRSVIQGESLGVSTGQIMRNLAVDMRARRRKAAEEQAQKAPIKLLFPLVFLIFPVLLIVLFVPAFFQLQHSFLH